MLHDVRHWIGWMWAGLAVFWLVTSLRVKPAVRRQPLMGRAIEVAVLLLAALLFYDCPRFGSLDLNVVPGTSGIKIAALVLTMAGVLTAIVARAYLGSNWSGRPSIMEQHELIRRGPYALVRHPIYSGLLLAALGTAIAYGQVRSLLAVPVALAGLWLKVRAEERLLLESMGDEYLAYRQAVRSAIVPFIL